MFFFPGVVTYPFLFGVQGVQGHHLQHFVAWFRNLARGTVGPNVNMTF